MYKPRKIVKTNQSKLAEKIYNLDLPRQEKISRWITATGLSERAFYRLLARGYKTRKPTLGKIKLADIYSPDWRAFEIEILKVATSEISHPSGSSKELLKKLEPVQDIIDKLRTQLDLVLSTTPADDICPDQHRSPHDPR